MDLVRIWLRRIAGATGLSLAAPLGVLAVAAAVALGGGVGGLGSVGQAFSGPTLPDTGTTGTAAKASRNVAVTNAVPSTPVSTAAAGGPTAAGGPAAGGAPGVGTAPGTGQGPSSSPAPGRQVTSPARPPSGGGSTPGAGGGTAPVSPTPTPVQEIRKTVGNVLPEPVAPVTNQVLDTVLGPPGR
jgi:hypothetical protein